MGEPQRVEHFTVESTTKYIGGERVLGGAQPEVLLTMADLLERETQRTVPVLSTQLIEVENGDENELRFPVALEGEQSA